MNFIENSIDWPAIETNLIRKASKLQNSKDVIRMIKNIQADITLLSKAEVLDRRTKRKTTKPIIDKINQDIEMVEEFVLIAALLG